MFDIEGPAVYASPQTDQRSEEWYSLTFTFQAIPLAPLIFCASSVTFLFPIRSSFKKKDCIVVIGQGSSVEKWLMASVISIDVFFAFEGMLCIFSATITFSLMLLFCSKCEAGFTIFKSRKKA